MGEASAAFESWLCTRLLELELDEEVFSGYITGILDQDDTSAEENVDALVEILSEATTVPIQDACSEIVQHWQRKLDDENGEKEAARKAEQEARSNAAQKLLVGPSAAATGNSSARSARKAVSEEEWERKQAMLVQFGYEDEEDEDGGEGGARDERQSSQASRIDATLEKLSNTNRDVVASAQKAERDKQQADYTARVTQTKAAREKQLQQQQDRKDKAKNKVQKRERRR